MVRLFLSRLSPSTDGMYHAANKRARNERSTKVAGQVSTLVFRLLSVIEGKMPRKTLSETVTEECGAATINGKAPPVPGKKIALLTEE